MTPKSPQHYVKVICRWRCFCWWLGFVFVFLF